MIQGKVTVTLSQDGSRLWVLSDARKKLAAAA
jgi:hypothetical protein